MMASFLLAVTAVIWSVMFNSVICFFYIKVEELSLDDMFDIFFTF